MPTRRMLPIALALLVVAVLVGEVWAAQNPSTKRVSVDSHGAQDNGHSFDPAISADGRFVAFDSVASNLVAGDTNAVSDVFVRDRKTGKTRRVSVESHGAQGNGATFLPAISADGRFVAFDSVASNLVAGDTNGAADVFVRGRMPGKYGRARVAGHTPPWTGDRPRAAISAAPR